MYGTIMGVIAVSLVTVTAVITRRRGNLMAEPILFNIHKASLAAKLKEAKQAGDEEAERKFIYEAVKKFPNAIMPYIALHDYLVERGRLDEARKSINKILKIQRSNPEFDRGDCNLIYMKKIHLMLQMGEAPAAEREIEDGLRWLGANRFLLSLAALIDARNGKPDRQFEKLTVIRDIFPLEVEAHVDLYNVSRSRNDETMSEDILRQGQSSLPQSIALFIPYARMAHERQDWEEAVARWSVIQERFVLNAEGFDKGAEALRHLGRDDKADAVMANHPGHRAVPWPLPR
jgi:tetratricopeptide (TPR) repeat protein